MKKRIICLMLIISLLLSGCGFFSARDKDSVMFYYLCDRYQEDLCCVIVSEEREASGHMGDLPYLLALYAMGPVSDECVTPLPYGTRIHSQMTDGHVFLELSGIPRDLSDIEFSLACACLTMTCLDITNAEDVTIRHGDQETVMNRSRLTLYDTAGETIPTEETK